MDPFTGLGSTAVACARLGVNFIGSEIDETYLDEAVERTSRGGRTRARPAGTRRSADEESYFCCVGTGTAFFGGALRTYSFRE